jgi:ATP-dependent DNA helicase RecQ
MVRSKNQDAFLAEDGLVLTATVAFGMGIDKPDVRFVVHHDLPGSLEAFYQETGRAGRDGLPAETLLLYGMQDLVLRRQMIEQSAAPAEVKRIERGKLDALLGVCETASCRRQAILAHFGEVLSKPCGNCDTCLNPGDVWDATTAARKAFSAMLRTGQRFGAGHLIDILLGIKTERVQNLEHDRLPTFGVGTELDRKGWGAVFRQLIVRGLIEVDHDSFGALRMTNAAQPILRGAEILHFHRDRATAAATRLIKTRAERQPVPGAAAGLFEILRAERSRLAKEQRVPAYVIFHDSTLAAIATAQPKTLDELRGIPGMGQTKLDRYGPAILAAVNASSANR